MPKPQFLGPKRTYVPAIFNGGFYLFGWKVIVKVLPS